MVVIMQQVSLGDLLSQISIALDAVEADLLGATPYHSKRVSVLCLAMGRYLGYDDKRLFALAGCAMLHDNALTEYILSERPGKNQAMNMKSHCRIGQKNAEYFPFPYPIDGFVLYHHENVDGSGAFGRKEGEYPLEAAIIALADQVDVKFALQRITPGRLSDVRRFIEKEIGHKYGASEAEAALAVLDEDLLGSLTDARIYDTAKSALPSMIEPITDWELIRISGIVAGIIDYKSSFTKLHSIQIANKSWYMSGVYQYRYDERASLYTAAALHDVGKLFIPTRILEKPGSLTDNEFEIIKSHVRRTWEILRPIRGFDRITFWASNHHEKLDGSGYFQGLTGRELDFNSRLLACLDIYQAVREARPYHPARTHEDTMKVLGAMADAGFIDSVITKDLDQELAKLKDGIAPGPMENEK